MTKACSQAVRLRGELVFAVRGSACVNRLVHALSFTLALGRENHFYCAGFMVK